MAISSLMAVVSIASTALGAYSSMQQTNQQQQNARTQAALAQRDAQIAEQNAALAEEAGREARREAHDDAQRTRLEAARMVGRERAMSALSGAQVDRGSALDLNLDIVERGEVDALRRIEQGDQEDYQQRLKAARSTVQAQDAWVRADQASSAANNTIGHLTTGVSLLNSALQQGRNYDAFLRKNQTRL